MPIMMSPFHYKEVTLLMARPRDIRFYEEPLGDLPDNQLWLIEYHENSRKLVEYRKHSNMSTERMYE